MSGAKLSATSTSNTIVSYQSGYTVCSITFVFFFAPPNDTTKYGSERASSSPAGRSPPCNTVRFYNNCNYWNTKKICALSWYAFLGGLTNFALGCFWVEIVALEYIV